MRLLTDEQHAQIVEALAYRSDCNARDALATLSAAPSVEMVGYESVFTGFLINRTAQPDLNKPFYAIKETP